MKLQPNFSWQKYVTKEEDAREQFQFQLQNEHIQVANAVNSDIDDSSYWTRERQTSFTWIDGSPVYTKTIATVSWTGVGTVNTIPLGITGNFMLIDAICWVSNGSLSTSTTLFIPYLDVAAGANSIGGIRSGTNFVLTSGGTNYAAWSGYLTIRYVKV